MNEKLRIQKKMKITEKKRKKGRMNMKERR